MHSYLRTIGFSEYNTKKKINEIIDAVMDSPDDFHEIKISDTETVIELKKSFGEDFGIILHGTVDESGEIDVEYYFPYLGGKIIQEENDVIIEKHISNTSFAAACDDLRVGVSLVFYLQNGMDYLEEKRAKLGKAPVFFSALSAHGTILFPIQKTDIQINNAQNDLRKRTRLIEKAREGDTEAIETLTLEELDTVSKISRRILKEDVFTIVETTFMPYGVECDLYNVIAEIINVNKTENTITHEEIYVLTLDANGLIFDLAINKNDLLGEPKAGRRFKGPVWMQGNVVF